MSCRITRREARDIVGEMRERSRAALAVPGVRLLLTFGAIISMVCCVAVTVIAEAVAVCVIGQGDETAASALRFAAAVSAAEFLLLSPMIAGYMKMAYSAAMMSKPRLCQLFLPYSSLREWLIACAGTALPAVRWLLPMICVLEVAKYAGISLWLAISIAAALVWMRLWRILSVVAHRIMTVGIGALRTEEGNILSHVFRRRRVYTAAAIREIPVCLLSFASVLTLFVFHTIPLFAIRICMMEYGCGIDNKYKNSEITERIQ